jgi:Protein of unknown function (DUF3135)
MEFQLEEWQRLAQENPEEFERRRRDAIETLIAQAPAEHRERLRGLQFQIDLERRRAKTALGATVRLQTLMWERFGKLREALLALAEGARPAAKRSSARVIPFNKRV